MVRIIIVLIVLSDYMVIVSIDIRQLLHKNEIVRFLISDLISVLLALATSSFFSNHQFAPSIKLLVDYCILYDDNNIPITNVEPWLFSFRCRPEDGMGYFFFFLCPCKAAISMGRQTECVY